MLSDLFFVLPVVTYREAIAGNAPIGFRPCCGWAVLARSCLLDIRRKGSRVHIDKLFFPWLTIDSFVPVAMSATSWASSRL
jgi:hypothetical protein